MATAQATCGAPAHRERAHVVHDAATGAILHVHHTVEFEGGAPHAETPVDRALRHAGSPAGAKVIEVDPAEVGRHRSSRVDVASGKIVPA